MKEDSRNNQLEYLTEHYHELVDQVFRFTYLKTSNREVAEELTSECFLNTVTYLKEYEVKDIRAFLFQVARNKIIDFYRKKGRVVYSDDAVLANEESSSPEDFINRQDASRMMEKLKLLPDEDREVLVLRYIEDMSIKEVARIMGKNHVAVRVQIFRALRKARALFDNQ